MMRRRTGSSSTRTRYVVAALGLTMLLAVALAVMAESTAVYHRGTAERVLKDYAAFAAEGYAGRVAQRLAASLYPVLNLLTQSGAGRPTGRLPEVASLGSAADQQARQALQRAAGLFRLPLPEGALTLVSQDTSPATSRWIRDTLRVAARAYRPDWYLALVFGEGPRDGTVLAYTVSRDSAGSAAVAYGFLARIAAFAKLFEEAATRSPLLPASLTGGIVVDSVASVELLSPTRRVLYATESSYPSAFRGIKALDPIFGGLTAEVALRPAVAGRLIIGGLPRSRLPLLLGLLGVAGLLVVTAAYQLRREQELTRLRSDFVASVSHELRTPLAQIRMFTETLLLGRVRSDLERRRSLEILDQEARRLTHLVDNLLYVARGERSTQPLTPELLELAPAVREVAESFAPLALAAGVTVEPALEAGLSARVDSGALRQILLNLLDNAIKYGPAGGRVTLGLERAGPLARIRVDDQGPGVPVSERERVWERFTRLDRDVDSAIAGSGIGLAIVRDLVAAHGGASRIEDAPGGGARFVVELPA
jgi:signal transduction histidine kinase